MTSDLVCLLVTWIAYAANNSEKVQSHHGLLVVELLENTREEVRSGEGGCDGRTQSQELL
jgi:hypothetical protein